MKLYFAPLVGVTEYMYRTTHHACFPSVDKYFTPFVSPTDQGIVKSKEFRDVRKENNENCPTVPQVLTNEVSHFLATVKQLKEQGYTEVNLNLGCPSGPVVSRGRGSGFLAHPNELKEFLDQIFCKSEMKISIKTRIGKEDPEEFYKLMELFNQYPMEELIVHPRVQTDFYKNTPNRKVFIEATKGSPLRICYNGEITTVEDYNELVGECPNLYGVMLGRGLLANPGLAEEIVHGTKMKREEFYAFHNVLFDRFKKNLMNEVQVIRKVKQFWYYAAPANLENQAIFQQVKFCETIEQYEQLIKQNFVSF